MNYLKNDICSFKPLFKLTKTKKKIVSTSLFRIKGGGYKKFYTYIEQLRHVNRYVVTNMKGFIQRLFIDETIYSDKKLMNILEKLKLEIVVYSCPDFMIDEKHHQGTFGTLVRFFPLFDFPNNDAEIVLPSDIDFGPYDEVVKWSRLAKLYHAYNIMVEKNTWKEIDYAVDVEIAKYENKHYHLFAGRQASKGDLDRHIIVNFLKNIDKKTERLTSYDEYQKNIDDSAGKFIYGVDEWFMDYDLYNYISREKIPYVTIVRFNISRYIFSNSFGYQCWKRGNCPWYDRFFKFILPQKKFRTTLDGIRYLKKTLMHYTDHPDIKPDNDLILRIYLYFISVLGTRDEKYFGEGTLSHILSEKYIGKFYSTEFTFQNSDQESFFMTDKKNLRTLPKKDVDYLKSIMGYI